MKCICTLNCRGIYSAFPPAKLQIPAASQLTWHCQHLLCALPVSGPPRTLFFMVKKGIFFVLNPSSLLWAKQNRDSWGKDLGKVLSYMGKSLTPLTAPTGSHLLWRDGIETFCAIRLQHLSSPAVFSWQISRAPQGSAPSSQGRSTWPPALWVSGLSGCQTANWRSFTRSAGEPTCCHCPPPQGVWDKMTHQHDSGNALGHSKSGNLSFATDTETSKDSKNCVGQAPKWEDISMTQFNAILEMIKDL